MASIARVSTRRWQYYLPLLVVAGLCGEQRVERTPLRALGVRRLSRIHRHRRGHRHRRRHLCHRRHCGFRPRRPAPGRQPQLGQPRREHLQPRLYALLLLHQRRDGALQPSAGGGGAVGGGDLVLLEEHARDEDDAQQQRAAEEQLVQPHPMLARACTSLLRATRAPTRPFREISSLLTVKTKTGMTTGVYPRENCIAPAIALIVWLLAACAFCASWLGVRGSSYAAQTDGLARGLLDGRGGLLSVLVEKRKRRVRAAGIGRRRPALRGPSG